MRVTLPLFVLGVASVAAGLAAVDWRLCAVIVGTVVAAAALLIDTDRSTSRGEQE